MGLVSSVNFGVIKSGFTSKTHNFFNSGKWNTVSKFKFRTLKAQWHFASSIFEGSFPWLGGIWRITYAAAIFAILIKNILSLTNFDLVSK